MNTNVLKYGNSVRVRNQTLQPKDHFVHLVSVTPVGAAPLVMMPMNVANGRVVESNFYGSYHKENAVKDYVILFAGDDNSYSYDSIVYDVPMTNEIIHNYLLGVEPSVNYYVSSEIVGGNIRLHISLNNHTAATLYPSTSGGILSFELTDYAGLEAGDLGTNNLNVYYQSNTGNVVIESYLEEMNNTQVEVYATSGQLISSTLYGGGISRIEMPVGPVAAGMYIVKVKSNDVNKGTYKLVIN
jgi:hypothetical protein